jgi:hypothetical protein
MLRASVVQFNSILPKVRSEHIGNVSFRGRNDLYPCAGKHKRLKVLSQGPLPNIVGGE